MGPAPKSNAEKKIVPGEFWRPELKKISLLLAVPSAEGVHIKKCTDKGEWAIRTPSWKDFFPHQDFSICLYIVYAELRAYQHIFSEIRVVSFRQVVVPVLRMETWQNLEPLSDRN